eukprot:11747283-Ditylum_brightwellii.AAC.1
MGGTMVGMVGRTMRRVIATGIDPRGMGRWAYVYITGKDNRNIYIISSYRATKMDNGEESAHAQQ